ncbi:probable disease resistance protein At4g27220 isoform X2 [Vitis riparia]|uniref:probable disease resistance protein At4g27220 isoform X2 n=1 Tax=Vitis riparia TaxID=96939 RepID=UPI00155AE52E|nr:probable disease resistance protein At4g27220 isoform X2 [Vitis riparia]
MHIIWAYHSLILNHPYIFKLEISFQRQLFAMEYVDAILTSIGLLKDMWSSISNCFNYQKILDENCTTLREKMERLKCREHDINTILNNAQYDHRKKEKKEVENWLIKVQHMKDRAQKIEQEAAKKRCFSRLRFLSQFEANIKQVDELIELGKFPDGILIDVLQDEGMTLLTTQLIGETTTKRILEEIWTCLKKGEIQSIGVWGMGGIGKTTVVTHIYNRLLENSSTFGQVYWVTVSQESSTRDLQDAIAKMLKIDFSEEGDDKKRSALLFKALQKLTKFVLIFDDMWEVHEPEQVGIPVGVDGGKLIITTRSKNICSRMCCKEIKVESLCTEEAWELFNKTLGRYSALNREEEEIAKDIVKECAGLPLAIVTTAKSMRGVYDICEWRNALNELRGRTQGLTIDMENDVFKILEFSYDRLNDEKLRECLLYCALFPEDYLIRRVSLIKYWIAEGIVGEMETRQAEFDKGHAILNKLENVCLLERCRNGKCVKMHDVIRDMAINISKRNSRFMVKTTRNLNDLPSEIQWLENLERVSLMDNQLSSLKSVPNCPKLSTLLLKSRDGLYEGLPNAFFGHMPSLKVLDLSYTSIYFIPDSISNLVNLRALFLRRCEKLNHVPSLAKLKELRELDLSESGMTELPDGIEQLALLKCLALQGLSIKDMSLNRALPNLLHLQCLRLDAMGFPIVGIEKPLIGLRKLEILSINLYSLHTFNSYMRTTQFQRLTHYYVEICGGVWPPGNSPGREVDNYQLWDGDPRFRDSLGKEIALFRCELNQGREDNDECQLMLPTNIQLLEIAECSLPTCLVDVSPSLKIARDLKVCSISDCKGVEYLWCMEDCVASLNNLYLDGLPDLNVLFKLRPINTVSCSSLKHLEVGSCGNLKHLFTQELVNHHLQTLQTIYVNDCNQMEDIIVATEIEEEGEEIDEMNNLLLYFPNLKRLQLRNLPELKSIWKGTMTHDSLQELEVWECPKLRRLPLSVHITDGDGERRASTSPLKKIKGEFYWGERVEWDTHPHAQFVFQPLPIDISLRRTRLETFVRRNVFMDVFEEVF